MQIRNTTNVKTDGFLIFLKEMENALKLIVARMIYKQLLFSTRDNDCFFVVFENLTS